MPPRPLGERPECTGQEKTAKVGEAVTFTRVEARGEVATLLLYTSDQQVDAAAANVDTPLRAHVSAGTGGANLDLDFDVENGVAVTVPAGVVTVTISYDLDPDAPAPTAPPVNVGLVLHEAARPGTTRPIRTIRTPSLANNATVIVAVPKFAATVSVLVNDPTAYGVNILLEFFRAPAGRVRGALQVLSEAEKRIPGGTRSVAVTNRTGGAIVPTLVFGLHL